MRDALVGPGAWRSVHSWQQRGWWCAAKQRGVPFRASPAVEVQDVRTLTATADGRHVCMYTAGVGCLSLCLDRGAVQEHGKADPWQEAMPGAGPPTDHSQRFRSLHLPTLPRVTERSAKSHPAGPMGRHLCAAETSHPLRRNCTCVGG